MDVYLAVGHGMQPNGVFDPGAVGLDGTQEHTLATAVTTAASMALSRAGVSFQWESNAGAGHDPDYRGSVNLVNALNPKLAIEIHFDANNAPRGGFGIYVSDAGHRCADLIHTAFQLATLPTRPNYKDVRGLYFLKATHCPAVIFECDRTMAQPDLTMLTRMGEAIALGIIQFLGFKPVSSPSTPGGGRMQPDYKVHIVGDFVSDFVPPEGGLLQFTDLGYVYAWGGAQYAGSPAASEAQTNWAAGHRKGAKIGPSPVEGKHYRCWAESGEYYDCPI